MVSDFFAKILLWYWCDTILEIGIKSIVQIVIFVAFLTSQPFRKSVFTV